MLVTSLVTRGRRWSRSLGWWLGLLGLLVALSMLPSAGVFRWSFRWLPLLHLVLALAAAEAWSLGDDTTERENRWRHCGGLVGVLIGVGYLALCGWSLPEFDRHALDLALIAAAWAGIGAAAVGRPVVQAWLPAGVVAAAVLSLFLRVPPNLAVPVFPFDESFLDAAPLDRERLHMSLYVEEDLPTTRLRPGAVGQAFRPGNSAMLAGIRMINGYSPIHPRGISTMLPFEAHGQMFPKAVQWAFARGAGPGDVLAVIGVDALIVTKHAAGLGSLPAGEWDKVWSGDEADVYHRRGVAGRTAAIVARDAPADRPPARLPLLVDGRHRAAIDLPAADEDRLVVFPRPWYPGWQAMLDSQPLVTTAYQNVAIAAAVPPGEAGQLEIRYRPAGFMLGLPIALVAALITLWVAIRGRASGSTADVLP